MTTSVGALVPWGGACLPITHPEAVYELRQAKNKIMTGTYTDIEDVLVPGSRARGLFLAEVRGREIVLLQDVYEAFDRAIEKAKMP